MGQKEERTGRYLLRDKSGRPFLIVEGCKDKLDAILYGLRNHLAKFGWAQELADLAEQRERLVEAFRKMGLSEREAEIAAEGRGGGVEPSVRTVQYSEVGKTINLG